MQGSCEWSPTPGHFVGAELEEEGRRKRDRDCLIYTIHSVQFQVGRDPVAKLNIFFFFCQKRAFSVGMDVQALSLVQ